MSEYQLLRAAAGVGMWLVLVLFLAACSVVFLSVLRHVIDMAYGDPKPPVADARPGAQDGKVGILIVVSAIGLLLLLGLWMPVWFKGALGSAARAGARVTRLSRPATRCRWRPRQSRSPTPVRSAPRCCRPLPGRRLLLLAACRR
jgi:formate hydrogenlyase subunit 3/multisubunit Na+/H+ antiporter MnhD subunit